MKVFGSGNRTGDISAACMQENLRTDEFRREGLQVHVSPENVSKQWSPSLFEGPDQLACGNRRVTLRTILNEDRTRNV
ncbi:hypothetical protein WCLP8_2830006 [uncultured Gammaproteobacteria bacterium]